MQKAILFDLDDTLIDTRSRHYEVVRSFLENSAVGNVPGFSDYCSLRLKAGKNIDVINRYLPGTQAFFHEYWYTHIESPEFLMFDKVIVDEEGLLALKQRGDYVFILLSLRTNTKNALTQFSSFRFSSLFDEVFFLAHNKTANPKTGVISELKNRYSIHSFIGDSPSDFDSAKESGIDFIGVETGWYSPGSNKIFPSINAVISTL